MGDHPESGKPITASIGRYGPYLAHDGKYAKLSSTRDVFEAGMNAAVTLLAEAANRGGAADGPRPSRSRPSARIPTSGGEIKVMPGRYGPYVTDGTTNATIPKAIKPEDITEEQAIALIDERAAKGPAKKKGRKAPAKKAPAEKTPGKLRQRSPKA